MNEQLKIELIDHMGSDRSVANAAWVSTAKERDDASDERVEGIIRYLATSTPMHSSPFEHVTATFRITAPLFVRDQWVRHRTQSYNSMSLRYSRVEGSDITKLFYIPTLERPLINEGSKSRPRFVDEPSLELYSFMAEEMEEAYYNAYTSYLTLLDEGIAEEVARNVLPEATMTKFYATANMLNWWRFVTERTAENAQWEIKKLANDISTEMSTFVPVSWWWLMNRNNNG